MSSTYYGFILALFILFALLGMGLLIGGIITYTRQRRRFAGMTPVNGEVIDLRREVVNPGKPGILCPVVRFTSAAGQEVEFQSAFGSRPAMHKVGQRVRVLYDPAEPHNAEIDSAVARGLSAAVMLAMGAIFLCLGCGFLAFYAIFKVAAGSGV